MFVKTSIVAGHCSLLWKAADDLFVSHELKELIVCGSEVRRVLGNVADHVVRRKPQVLEEANVV